MQKLFLLAFMAISFSYASGIQTTSELKKASSYRVTCAQYAQNVYNDWRAAGFSPSEAREREREAYDDCRQKERDGDLKG